MTTKLRVNRKMLVVAIVLAAATLVVGKSSKLITSWRNPSYAPAKKFHRVLAMGFSNKMEVRADFEDALAAELTSKGLEAVAGNTILLRPPGSKLDLNYLREQTGRPNQAVFVSRLVKVDETVTYVPGTPYSCRIPTTTLSQILRHTLSDGLFPAI
jgi:hypothetical protein